MGVLIIALLAFVLYIVAYHTYGKWLARRIFRLDSKALPPSEELNDGQDYVPTSKGVVFGHHFTSIAGTGPIVGPALAVIWGWLPALLWVLFGSIFIGAVHDFGALVVSMRNKGKTLGDLAGTLIGPRIRFLFLLILLLALTIVLAIFGLVISGVFRLYPASIFPCLLQIPLALIIGIWLHRKGVHLLFPSIIALGLMFLSIYFGNSGWLAHFNHTLAQLSTMWWVIILLLYSYFASVLPVWTLLQPRDYINSLQLITTLGLLFIGLLSVGLGVGVVSFEQGLHLSAPMIRLNPEGAPPIFPFLFITIACGAISGFHCLVSSGTSSKQIRCETDAQFIGYGSMLTEGFLATIVIIACIAGLGLGSPELLLVSGKFQASADTLLYGEAAYWNRYDSWGKAGGLAQKVGAFIDGSANFLRSLGLNSGFAVALMGTFVASFAATTLDSACRLQRYIIQELFALGKKRAPLRVFTKKHPATLLAISLAAFLAFMPGPKGPGSGGVLLWPLFGATNQLLGGMAFIVILFWLRKKSLPIWYIVPPALLMLLLPSIAMVLNIHLFYKEHNWLLFGLGLATLILEVIIITETWKLWLKNKSTPSL